MTDAYADHPGFGLVCAYDGIVNDVLWDDLGILGRMSGGSHFACILDPGSVQKGLALLLYVKEHRAAFGWELNVTTDGGPVPVSFAAAVLLDRVVLLATIPSREEGQIYNGLSHVINEQINALRTLNRRSRASSTTNATATASTEASPVRFDQEMLRDMLQLNNRLINAERELARKNSELKRMSAMLSKDLQLAHRVLQCTGEAVAIADRDRRVVDINQAYTAITGFTRQEMLGQPLKLTETEQHDDGFVESIWEQVASRGSWQGECVGRRRSGALFPEWLSVSSVPDERGGPGHYVVNFSDISRLKTAEEKWQRLAFYDSLTRLPNRVLFKDRLQQAIVRARRDEEPLVLMFIDLDEFKIVNDSLGHDAGDELLRQAARRIEACVRETDSIARLGGDEFTVIMNGLDSEYDIMLVCDKIIQTFAAPFLIGEQNVHVGTSIGIARYPVDGEDPDTLTKNADAAMYAAKSAGRNTSRFFSRSLGERVSRHLQVKTEIARGLQLGEFSLHLQPEVDLHSGRMVALEALIRWNHPEQGFIPPDQFIPIAEESGLIVELGEFVIREAIRLVKELRSGCCPDARIAVNVSRRQIAAPGLVDFIVAELGRHELPGTALIVEVTESMTMGNLDHTIQVLQMLKDHGIGSAIDDFGTGYSSLNYLRRLPAEFLKIDKSFIADADVSRESETIIRAITAMARSLELKTVAEGVERSSQHELLRTLGCDIGQGFWFARPQPVESLVAALEGGILVPAAESPGG